MHRFCVCSKYFFCPVMAPVLSLLVGSLLAISAFADPFEKLFSVPKGK